MKKSAFIILLTVVVTSSYSFAQMGGGMMGQNNPRAKYKAERPYYEGGYYPCPRMMGPGMMGYGMGPGMMGYGMGHMGGMMGPGMMGYGMGPGMMGYGRGTGMWGYTPEEYKEYMDKTLSLRKKLHNKRFEYFEAARNPDADRKTLMKLEKELMDLQWEIYEKAPR